MIPGPLARARALLVGLLAGNGIAAAVAAPLTVTVVGHDQQPLAGTAVAVAVDGVAARNPAATATLAQRQRRFAPDGGGDTALRVAFVDDDETRLFLLAGVEDDRR